MTGNATTEQVKTQTQQSLPDGEENASETDCQVDETTADGVDVDENVATQNNETTEDKPE